MHIFYYAANKISIEQGSPTWRPRAPGRLQGPCTSPAGLF